MPEPEGAAGDVKNVLTRKVGPLPMWGWGVTAIIVFVLVARYRKSQAATTGTSAVTTPVSSPLGYSSGADSASVDSFLQQLQTELADIQKNSGAPTQSGIQETLSGSGYSLGMGNETPIQGSDGNWYSWLSPQAAPALWDKVKLFFQPAPGVFEPLGDISKLNPGTPVFFQTGPPVPGYNYNPPTPPAGGPAPTPAPISTPPSGWQPLPSVPLSPSSFNIRPSAGYMPSGRPVQIGAL